MVNLYPRIVMEPRVLDLALIIGNNEKLASIVLVIKVKWFGLRNEIQAEYYCDAFLIYVVSDRRTHESI